MSEPDHGAGQRDEGEDHILEAEPGRYGLELAQSTFLSWATFAQRWYWDALEHVPGDEVSYFEERDALRRQVVFAVCALESWFFEWVRDELLEERIDATDVFGGYATFPERVKGVMREVERRGGLERPFTCGESSEWEEVIALLGVRNGLVHAGASRVGGNLPEGTQPPEPTAADLRALAPFEPLRIVRDAVRFLTSFADQEEPAWMQLPDRE